jgi:septum formation protein
VNKLPSHVWLASRSPRRSELLAQLGIACEIIDVNIDESPLSHETPEHYVCRVAQAKAQAAFIAAEHDWPLIAADTCVVVDDVILGKPGNANKARDMLQRLSGCQHRVLTAVTVYCRDRYQTVLCTSLVTFRSLSADDIHTYIASGEPLDKAGSYAIQGLGARFIRHLEGSYSGVMGLPLYETAELLSTCHD